MDVGGLVRANDFVPIRDPRTNRHRWLRRQPMQIAIKLSPHSQRTDATTAYLNVPSSLPQAMETELISDFGCVHGVGQVLLVGEDEEESVSQLILVQHAL